MATDRKNKIIIILGPTASGKTGLAILLAKRLHGEIISADSRQVYKYMNLGTGKDLGDYRGVKYHAIDVVSPKKQYSVADWLKEANRAILEIQKKGKLPIVCGGTGFYISALTEGLSAVEQDEKKLKKIRAELNKLGLEKLLKKLKKIDLKTYCQIDKKNRRRVQRALEIYLTSGQKKSELKKQKNNNFKFFKIGVSLSKEALYKKIEKRLDQRLGMGMLKEIDKLRKLGVSWKRLKDFGLEYKWLALYKQGKISKKEMRDNLLKAIKNYSKRQMTWFKRDKNIIWVKSYKNIEKLVRKFIL